MGAALLALFLGAMDALIMSAAMPTIVADLGGLHLYSWVYSTYFLSRAVSLPIFGKLADTYRTKTLFMVSIGLFVVSSVFAGASPNMAFLVAARVFQGIGAGGNFALVYIALADVSEPEKRGRAMSFASFIWGLASVLGPTLGGVIVTWTSWRWIFFLNVPLGLASLAGISLYLVETREKKTAVSLDLWGAFTLSATILAFLTALMMGGRTYGWGSGPILGLLALAAVAGAGFYEAEKRAADPILSLRFFTIRGFAAGNGAVFFSSFAIFSLFAFGPLFIQGALGKSPVQVGVAMLWLSLGWSLGSIALGPFVDRMGGKISAVSGAGFLIAGSAITLTFTLQTSMATCSAVFFVIGIGMGFVTLSTLVEVQNSVGITDLGVATASNQFARTLGGTVGIGVCGSLVFGRLHQAMETLTGLPSGLADTLRQNLETLFQPAMQAGFSEPVRRVLQGAVVDGVSAVFWVVSAAGLLCLAFCLMLPGRRFQP
ncbi:MAG: MFS transporter [Desulfobacterales bacterium]|nr:MFS transporter [Desulfobacterales bacterium]